MSRRVYVVGLVVAIEHDMNAENPEEVQDLLERVFDDGFFQNGDFKWDWGYFPHRESWCYSVERVYPDDWDIDMVLRRG